MKSLRRDLYRYQLLFTACNYCKSGIGDVITWVNERTSLNMPFRKSSAHIPLKCALIRRYFTTFFPVILENLSAHSVVIRSNTVLGIIFFRIYMKALWFISLLFKCPQVLTFVYIHVWYTDRKMEHSISELQRKVKLILYLFLLQ